MINRSKMRRQLYRGGGITGLYPRQKYGIGSWVKERVRKLIPNELADVAVKAAPFVAPFYPGAAALMRGIGRFDQRGSMSDALKQGALTYAGGRGARYLAGAEGPAGGLDTFSMDRFREGPVGKLFQSGTDAKKLKDADSIKNTPDFMQNITEKTIGKIPLVEKLPPMVQQKLLVGGAIAGASALASYFKGDFRPQEEGESMEEYLAARKDAVGKQMRIYMDNYFKFDPEYSQLDDAGRNAFVARYNVAQGGRIGYQTGGISALNTAAQNRAINQARQQQFSESIAPAQERVRQRMRGVPEQRTTQAQEPGILSQDDKNILNQGARLFTSQPRYMPINTSKYLGDGMTTIYHGTEKVPEGGFKSTRVKPVSTLDDLSRAALTLSKPMSQGVYVSPVESVARGYASPESSLLRGIKESGTGTVLKGQVPSKALELSRNMFGQIQAQIPSDLANKAFNLTKDVASNPAVRAVANPVGKFLSRAVPVAGTGLALTDAASRLKQGDYVGAGLGAASAVPVLGLPALGAQVVYDQLRDPNARTTEEIARASQYGDAAAKPYTYQDIRDNPKYEDQVQALIPAAKAKWIRENPGELEKAEAEGRNPLGTRAWGDLAMYMLRDKLNATGTTGITSTVDPKMQQPGEIFDDFLARGGDPYYAQNESAIRSGTTDFSDMANSIITDGGIKYRIGPGGRIGYRMGMGPAGLPGIPRMAPDGMEFDMRQNGGFQPLGAKEKKDDVPAMLAKNEFVMTADAVRGAGNGDIELGAQKMYDTMKNLERRVT